MLNDGCQHMAWIGKKTTIIRPAHHHLQLPKSVAFPGHGDQVGRDGAADMIKVTAINTQACRLNGITAEI